MTQLTSAPETDDALLQWRDEFPILEHTNYLISNSLGAMPRRVYDQMREFADTWGTRGVRAWEEGWWEMAVSVGDILGRVIGAQPGEISLHQNVTIVEAIVFSALRPTPERNRVVYSDLNFPSIRYFYQAQEGIEIQTVPSPDGIHVPPEAMLEAIDERTLVVPISHVIFKSAFLQDAEAIVRRAHEVGALVVLDTYQSCGTVPFDVHRLGADFVVGGSVKWLCGGPGVAYLWVRPELRDSLQPRFTGWMAHARPFDFDPEMEYVSSAYRFLNGTPNVPALYAARSGYEILAEIGVEPIRRKSIRLTQRIIELADGFGFEVNSPRDPERRGGTVSVNPPNAWEVSRKMLDRQIMIDFRPGAGIRMAPHFYNTLQEVEDAMAQMNEIVQEALG